MSVCMLNVHILLCLSPLWQTVAVHAMEAHLVLLSTHAWSAAGKLRDYFPCLHTHRLTRMQTHTHRFLPQVFGCALLELAPRLVCWMCTQEETLLQTARLRKSHDLLDEKTSQETVFSLMWAVTKVALTCLSDLHCMLWHGHDMLNRRSCQGYLVQTTLTWPNRCFRDSERTVSEA